MLLPGHVAYPLGFWLAADGLRGHSGADPLFRHPLLVGEMILAGAFLGLLPHFRMVGLVGILGLGGRHHASAALAMSVGWGLAMPAASIPFTLLWEGLNAQMGSWSGRNISWLEPRIAGVPPAVFFGYACGHYALFLSAYAAVRADPRFAVIQASITGNPSGNPSGNLVLVSGPIAGEIGVQSGAGCLGPRFWAKATIGRAINLAFTLVGPVIPGVSDLGVLGSPAEYSYCFGENLGESPWPSPHQELYDASTTTVTVHKGAAPLDASIAPRVLTSPTSPYHSSTQF